MNISIELIISLTAFLIGLLLLIFTVDWRYFRDWVVVFLYEIILNTLMSAMIINTGRIEYVYRQLPQYFKMSLLYELWAFPILSVLYNQVTRERGLWPVLYYAVFFSAGITALEYPLELYTDLIEYHNWSWFTSLYTITLALLSSRVFIAFFRWGCVYFERTKV